MSSSLVALVAGVFLFHHLTSPLTGRDFDETVPSDTVELLASDRAEEITRGEDLVKKHGSAYIKELLERIRSGTPEAKGKAAAELGIIISPWLRGKEAGARALSFVAFPSPRRPVGRVTSLAEAAEIRQTIQTAFADVLKIADDPPGLRRNDVPIALSRSLAALSETLGEVANDETMDWMIDRLKSLESPALAEPLFALAGSYLGVFPIFRQRWICGNSSSFEIAKFGRAQEQALVEASSKLRKLWTEVRPMKTEERIAFAIRGWREYVGYIQKDAEGFHFFDMEPLVRFGAPAIEALRAEQARETKLDAKAVWETVIATITGREDAQLVRRLFEGTDNQRELACEIVVGATSRAWLPQLEELRLPYPRIRNIYAIATCHRDAGLPALKRVHAEHAIKELELRRDSGPPRGMRRYHFP